jgi:hypothetical protein
LRVASNIHLWLFDLNCAKSKPESTHSVTDGLKISNSCLIGKIWKLTNHSYNNCLNGVVPQESMGQKYRECDNYSSLVFSGF